MKRLNILLAVSLLFIFFFSACYGKRCDCFVDNLPNATMETYFSNYKYGSQSWVYINQDGTKKDSVYITWDLLNNGRGAIIDDEIKCEINYSWSTLIRGKYLSKDTVRCRYANNDFTFYTYKDYYFEYTIRHKAGLDSLIVYTRIKSYNAKKETITLPSGVIYNGVINVDKRFWFAPYVGLIKYVSYNEYNKPDTFYLQNFYSK